MEFISNKIDRSIIHHSLNGNAIQYALKQAEKKEEAEKKSI